MQPIQNFLVTARGIRQSYAADNYEEGSRQEFNVKGASEYVELSGEMNNVLAKVRQEMEKIQQIKSEHTDLVTGTLPVSVAERFRNGESPVTDTAPQATAAYIQLRGFRSVFEKDNMQYTMAMQEFLDNKVRQAASRHGVDFFNQIGMNYVAVCGLTMPYLNHLERTLQVARECYRIAENFNSSHGVSLVVSVSIDVGPMFGVLQIGEIVDYDILGDTINGVQKIGYAGTSGIVTCTENVVKYCAEHDLTFPWKKSATMVHVDDIELALWDLSVDDLPQRR